MRKRVTGLVVSMAGIVGVGLIGSSAPAGAEQYPPAENGIAVVCPTPAAGETVGVTARTFTPGADVTVTIDPGPTTLGNAAAGGDGAVVLDVTIPEDIQPGDHTITATGQAPDGVLTLTARVTVGAAGSGGCAGAPSEGATPPAAPPSSDDSDGGSLPFTGSGLTMLLLQIALALAAAGGILLALSRRRRTHAAHAATPSA
jgi:hypothetical protein